MQNKVKKHGWLNHIMKPDINQSINRNTYLLKFLREGYVEGAFFKKLSPSFPIIIFYLRLTPD